MRLPVMVHDTRQATPKFNGKFIGDRTFRHPTTGELYSWHIFSTQLKRFSLIMPFTDSGDTVIVVRQFRHGRNSCFYEFPGGTPNSVCDSDLEVAKRELEEETGYTAGEIAAIPAKTSFAIDPSNNAGFTYFFVARYCRKIGMPKLDKFEFAEVLEMPITEWFYLIDTGEVTDLKTLAMTFLWQRHKNLFSK